MCHHQHFSSLLLRPGATAAAAAAASWPHYTADGAISWSLCHLHRVGGAEVEHCVRTCFDFFVVASGRDRDGPCGAGASSQRQRVHQLAEGRKVSAHTEERPPPVHQPAHDKFPRRSAQSKHCAEETVCVLM